MFEMLFLHFVVAHAFNESRSLLHFGETSLGLRERLLDEFVGITLFDRLELFLAALDTSTTVTLSALQSLDAVLKFLGRLLQRFLLDVTLVDGGVLVSII